MNKIYESLKIEVEGGQYAKATMIAKLDYAWSINKITQEQHTELTSLVETCVDPNYKPVKTQAQIDGIQDVRIEGNEMGLIETFEMIMSLHEESSTSTQKAKMASVFNGTRSAIGDTYVRAILYGNRTFDSVHQTKRNEVAEKLTAMGRCDLINMPEYHEPHVDCPHGNTPPVEDAL